MNHPLLKLLSIALAGLALVTLAGCPVPDMTSLDGNTNTNEAVGGNTDVGTNSNTGADPTTDSNSGDAPNDAGATVLDPTDPNQTDSPPDATDTGTDPVDNGGTTDPGTSDSGGQTGGTPPSDGGQSGGQDGDPPADDPVDTPPAEPCTQTLVGFGSNPGDGSGDTFTLGVNFTGPAGAFVTINPVLPVIGASPLVITPSTEGSITFGCDDQVTLGQVVFTDENGLTNSPGEVTLLRGVDFACGQPTTIMLFEPCTVELAP